MDYGGPFSLSHSFERHLRAKNLSDGTVASYLVGVRQFSAFLVPRGRGLEAATGADLEAFIAELLTSRSAATASTRYKQLQALYRWLEDEEEIGVNPMARMKPPMVPAGRGADLLQELDRRRADSCGSSPCWSPRIPSPRSRTSSVARSVCSSKRPPVRSSTSSSTLGDGVVRLVAEPLHVHAGISSEESSFNHRSQVPGDPGRYHGKAEEVGFEASALPVRLSTSSA